MVNGGSISDQISWEMCEGRMIKKERDNFFYKKKKKINKLEESFKCHAFVYMEPDG